MVRGTNKMVIEINDTGNPYFDRAVLYVKEHPINGSRTVEDEAQQYLATIQTVRYPHISSVFRSIGWKRALQILLGTAAGAALLFFLF